MSGAAFERFVGVGLGIDVHSPQPDWRALLSGDLSIDFLEVYTRGVTEEAHAVRAASAGLPLLYHDDAIDPIVPGALDEAAVARAAENMAAVGAPWCVSELATRRLGDRYLDFFQPILLTEEAAQVAAGHLRGLSEALPGAIVPENPPFQLPVGPLHILELVARVVELAEVSCVLDLGHLLSFQQCRGLEPLTGVDDFPLEAVVELHVAGAELDRVGDQAIYRDTHGASELPPVLLEMLAEVAPRCPRLRAVTIEVEDATRARVARQLEQTRAAVQGLLDARGTA